MVISLSVSRKKDRRLQFRLVLFSGGRSNSLLADVLVIFCFLTVIPLALSLFKLEVAFEIIDKRKRKLYDRYLERRIKKSLLKQMKKIAENDYRMDRVWFWRS